MGYNKEQIDFINRQLALTKEEETFYITKDNNDGSTELVHSLKCDIDVAYEVFLHVINEQCEERRKSHIKWRVIRLFDSKTGEQIAQES